MLKLTLPPDQAGFAFTPEPEVLRSQGVAGSRYRRDVIGAPNEYNVVWSLGPDESEYLKSFYDLNEYQGGEPFLIDLYMDTSQLQELEAHFIPGTFKLQAQQGLLFTWGAQLEVKPPERDYEVLEDLMELTTLYGSYAELRKVVNLLAELANESLPDALTPGTGP